MVAAHPFPPAELERILAKLAKGDPMTQDEREIVRRRLDEVPSVDALGPTASGRSRAKAFSARPCSPSLRAWADRRGDPGRDRRRARRATRPVRVVVDTNVVVSMALQSEGNPAHVVRLVRERALRLVYDRRVYAEYCEVLMRLRLPPALIADIVSAIAEVGERLDIVPPAPFVLPDPKDQPFLEVALAARADAIVTGNLRDFPDGCGMQILTPAQIAQRFPRER
jgi:putative PIN family toxin of toxin-antitoxin system